MSSKTLIYKILLISSVFILLKSCGIYRPTDAREFPPEPKKRVKCRKPAEQKASADVPTWLARVTSKRTTRRRIELSTRFDSAGDEIHMKLLYRNGFAHDENVGQIMKSLAKVGFEHVSGSGPRQLWKQPEGQRLELSPVPEDLNLGCDIKGPVLEIVLTKTSHGQ